MKEGAWEGMPEVGMHRGTPQDTVIDFDLKIRALSLNDYNPHDRFCMLITFLLPRRFC